MKHMKYIVGLISCAFLLSCEPRIDFDEGQWGDQAYITDVLFFTIQEQEHQLQEYYENGTLTIGLRRNYFTTTKMIDNQSATVIVELPANIDKTNIGVVIRSRGKKIVPLNGAPVPGFLDDFSTGPYTYQIISADGTVRNWLINIE